MIGWLLSLPYRFIASFGWPSLAAAVCGASLAFKTLKTSARPGPGRRDHRLSARGLVVPAHATVPASQRRFARGDGQSRPQAGGKQQTHRRTQAQALPALPVEWRHSTVPESYTMNGQRNGGSSAPSTSWRACCTLFAGPYRVLAWKFRSFGGIGLGFVTWLGVVAFPLCTGLPSSSDAWTLAVWGVLIILAYIQMMARWCSTLPPRVPGYPHCWVGRYEPMLAFALAMAAAVACGPGGTVIIVLGYACSAAAWRLQRRLSTWTPADTPFLLAPARRCLTALDDFLFRLAQGIAAVLTAACHWRWPRAARRQQPIPAGAGARTQVIYTHRTGFGRRRPNPLGRAVQQRRHLIARRRRKRMLSRWNMQTAGRMTYYLHLKPPPCSSAHPCGKRLRRAVTVTYHPNATERSRPWTH